MSKQMRMLLLHSVSSEVVILFINIFVNLYIWQESSSLSDLVWFNFAKLSSWSIFFMLGSYILYKTTLRTILRISSYLFVFLFLGVSFIDFPSHFSWIIFSGLMFGAAGGLGNSGKNIGLSFLAKNGEMTRFYQLRSLWTWVVNIVLGLSFATVLYNTSYQVLFILMLVLSTILFFISGMVPEVRIRESIKGTLFKDFSFRKVFSEGNLKILPVSYIVGPLFIEFTLVFMMFFTFQITSNEIFVALLNMLYVLFSSIAVWIYNRVNIREELWIAVGVLIALVGIVLFMYSGGMWQVFANILLVLGNFYYRTTYYSQHMKALNPVGSVIRIRVLIWREFILGFSRWAFLIVILVLDSFFVFESYFYTVMVLVILISLFVPSIHKRFDYGEGKVSG